MRLFIILVGIISGLLFTGNAVGETLKGQSNYQHLNATWTVEFILVYDPDTGKGTLSWRHFPNRDNEKSPKIQGDFYEAPFVMTQRPSADEGSSLFGYVVHRGTPLTLRIDLWEKSKPFFFHDPWWAKSVVIQGEIQ